MKSNTSKAASWKLISWNCCLPPWSLTRRKRRPQIVAIILKEKPDLICLQEVFLKSDRTFLIESFSKEGYRHNHYFQNLLIVSKLPLLSTHGNKFQSQGRIFSFSILDALYGKAFQRVKIKINGIDLVILNTHLLSAYALAAAHYQKTRSDQATEIIENLKKAAANNVIAAGDFNFEAHTVPYQQFINNGFIDLSGKLHKSIKRQLDFIFAKDLALEIVDIKAKYNELSDHPYLTLTLRNRRRA